eukprot:NODE_566_length_5965_cov_0.720934.p4 type:complete len:209 gc:universal NODE_566_length_5965_cov_0.720934:3256-3882(+)
MTIIEKSPTKTLLDTMTLADKEQKDLESHLAKLEQIDDKFNAEFQSLKEKIFKEKLPTYKKRDSLLAKIPNFWLACINNSPISQHTNDDDLNILQHLTGVSIDITKEFQKATLAFSTNDYIENSTLSKTVYFGENGKILFDKIKWAKNPKRTKSESESEFFKLFNDEETELVDALVDIYESAIEYFDDNDTEDTKSNETLKSSDGEQE